jgi:hypothetical protein
MPFPDSIRVSVDPARLFIGDSVNQLSFTIEPVSEAVEVWIRVTVPYEGPGTTFLVRADDSPVARFSLNGDLAQEMKKSKSGGAWNWEPSQKKKKINAANKLAITVANLTAKTVPGNARVSLKLEVGADRTQYEASWDISVVARDSDKPVIHFFDASPDFILHGGEEPVKISWWTTPSNALVSLSKNNMEVWKKSPAQEPVFLDKPSITSSYRLTVKAANDEWAVEQRTVHVAQAGWNLQTLPQGFPTLLLTIDEKASLPHKMYGVFVDSAGKPSLWSSPSGFADWQLIDEPFPRGMEFSPGVVYRGRLWLVGGSSVHPNQTSNKVWSFDPSIPAWKQEKDAPFPARMGHSCVVFQDRIWVLGGVSKNRSLQDVWSYGEQEDAWKPHGNAAWPARCMFAAVVTPPHSLFAQPRLWIYGGKPTANELVFNNEIWWTEDGQKWHDGAKFFQLNPVGAPSGATLFFDKDLMLAGSFLNGKRIASHVFKLHATSGIWEDNPVSWGWEQFGGLPFLLQSVVFNRFYFFWALAAEMGTAPKLNIFIP